MTIFSSMLGATSKGYKVHLAAVLMLTIAAIIGVIWLAVLNHPIPDVLTVAASGGTFYLIGTQTGAASQNNK